MAPPKEKIIPHLLASGTTITKSGRPSRSPKVYGHNENQSKCHRQLERSNRLRIKARIGLLFRLRYFAACQTFISLARKSLQCAFFYFRMASWYSSAASFGLTQEGKVRNHTIAFHDQFYLSRPLSTFSCHVDSYDYQLKRSARVTEGETLASHSAEYAQEGQKLKIQWGSRRP